MSDPPDRAKPRGTLPLGSGPAPSPAAPREASPTIPGGVRGGGYLALDRELPELPELPEPACEFRGPDSEPEPDSEPKPAAVKSEGPPERRDMFGWDDGPDIDFRAAFWGTRVEPRRSVRRRGLWARPPAARVAVQRYSDRRTPRRSALARFFGSIAARVAVVAFAAVVILALVVKLRLRQHGLELPELPAAQTSGARISPEPAPPAEPMSSAASAQPSKAHGASTARAHRPPVQRRAAPANASTSDVVDPWKDK